MAASFWRKELFAEIKLIQKLIGKFKNGRSERIRTSGPYVPNVVLYQAELHSDKLGRHFVMEKDAIFNTEFAPYQFSFPYGYCLPGSFYITNINHILIFG
jgi:hypothetical protein